MDDGVRGPKELYVISIRPLPRFIHTEPNHLDYLQDPYS